MIETLGLFRCCWGAGTQITQLKQISFSDLQLFNVQAKGNSSLLTFIIFLKLTGYCWFH